MKRNTHIMRKRPRKPKGEILTDKQLQAWNLYLQGKTSKVIAEECSVHISTVNRWIKSISEYMQESPQFQAAIPVIAGLIPDAIQVYAFHLKIMSSLQAAKDVLKMTGLFIEHIQQEHIGMAQLSDADIENEIKRLYADKLPQEAEPKVEVIQSDSAS